MAKYSTFEKLPVEIVELCLDGLPASSIGAMLGLSRQTRHLVLTSIEFMFAKMLKSFEEKKQYLGKTQKKKRLTTPRVLNLLVTVRSHSFVTVGHRSSPMDVAGDGSDAALFTCSAFRKDSDVPCRNFFEDICKVREENPIVVDRNGLLVNPDLPTSKNKDSKIKLATIDINPLKGEFLLQVIWLDMMSKQLARVACQGLRS
ncbi:hypothetical protein VP01_699g6 [Puccinia sorghi]|uniref:Uncharacterized protein n=1 Tax=Puccinia sorghi TaxID=27349 RepID=A0A0L6UDX1_9BASI|nr:hypothetical protein VP01_699g6 [Puccinia sorghi]